MGTAACGDGRELAYELWDSALCAGITVPNLLTGPYNDGSQFHVSEESKQMAAAGGMPPGMFSDFDGLAEMWMHDFDDFVRATRDPYYLEKIRPDEQYLLDTSASRVTMGREVELIRDGRDCFE